MLRTERGLRENVNGARSFDRTQNAVEKSRSNGFELKEEGPP